LPASLGGELQSSALGGGCRKSSETAPWLLICMRAEPSSVPPNCSYRQVSVGHRHSDRSAPKAWRAAEVGVSFDAVTDGDCLSSNRTVEGIFDCERRTCRATVVSRRSRSGCSFALTTMSYSTAKEWNCKPSLRAITVSRGNRLASAVSRMAQVGAFSVPGSTRPHRLSSNAKLQGSSPKVGVSGRHQHL
jgi:hypothetical protein